jgi:transcriptional regulator with GAF, ATPase, and Fis domain/Tfp pilus assembly protein PilF
VLYELLTGQVPFRGTASEVITAHLHGEVPPPDCHERYAEVDRQIFTPLAAVAMRLLSKEPSERYPGVRELEAALSTTISAAPGEGDALVHPVLPGLLGREAALSTLEEALTLSRRRSDRGPRIIAVRGGPGAGKTTLLREFKWRAQLAGVQVVEVFCDTSPLHLWPIPELVRRIELLTGVSEAVGRVDDDAKLADRAAEAAMTATRRAPLLIVVEDLHLASPEAIEALRYVAHAGTGEDRMLLVVSYCPESASAETSGTLGEHQEVDLRPLRPSEVGRLAGAILGRTDEELASAVHAWTGGNPLFCLETLRAIRDRGGESAENLEGLGVPRRLEEFWVARALEARPPGQRLIVAAAVLGHPVGVPALSFVANLDPDAVVEEIDVLASRGLLTRLPSGDVGLAHNGLAKGALSLVSQRDLEGMHERTARLLADAAAPPAEQAHHLLRAGDGGQLVGQALAVRAAHELIQAGASRAAAKLLRRAVTSWRGEEGAEQASLLLAEAYHGAGEYDDAADLLDGLLHRLTGDEGRAEALSLLGRVRMGRGDFSGAAEAWKDALQLIRDPSRRARLRRDLGRMLLKRGESAAAVEVTQAALAEVEPSDPVRADLLCTLGMAADYGGETAQAMSCYEEALAIARASGARREEAAVYTHQAITSQREGDYAKALDAYSKSLALAREAGDAGTMAVLHGNLGGLAYYSGEPVRALEHYSAALRLAQRVGRESTVVASRTNLGLLHLYLGEFERAKRELERALAGAERLGIRQMAAQATAHLGELALRLGQPDTAVDHYLEARSRYEAVGMRREAIEVALDLSVALVERGSGTDLRDASDHLDAVQAAIKEQGLDTLSVRSKLAQARLAAAKGEEERALTLYERAAREAQDQTNVEVEWEALAAAAEVLLRRGAPLAAKSKLQRAVELLEGVAATLPRELRKSFWQDPRRARVRRSLEEVLAGTVAPASRDSGKQSVADMLFRLLEINKRINSDPDLPKLLARIMDSAVELTDAERGFLLLVNEKGELEMTTARDFDQGTPDDAHLQFSRSIAETVLIDGEPVITVNAMDDTRFNEYLSVHQLKLQSVLGIPIRARGRVIGVLYMENRLRRGGFGEPDQRILLAFADQVAIALENSRLMAELTGRTQELERAKEEIEQLYEERGKLLSQRTAQLAAARRDLRRAMDQIQGRVGFQGIVGQSGPMLRIFAILERVRQTDVPVVITGESGTGKEMVARAIHAGGLRAKKPFVAINCGAIPETLLESELFGHVRGSFTGADRDKRGLLLAANGGTVFLDEIGDMPLKMQLDLLRVLQEKRVRPLGSERDLEIDVRVLAASNRPLRELIQRGTFREDLYYRLSVVEIGLPALRERADDVPLLVDHFLGQIAARFKANKRSVTRDAMRTLMAYPWPGNVRQLEHALMNAWVMCDGEAIDVADLTLEPVAARECAEPRPAMTIPTTSRDRRDMEKQRILESLEQTGWNKSKAAQVLNMPRRTLYRRLKAYGIQ